MVGGGYLLSGLYVGGGGVTYLLGWGRGTYSGGGVPTFWGGGVPTLVGGYLPSGVGGGTYSGGGGYLPCGRGYLPSGVAGVPTLVGGTYPGGGGTYLPGWGVPTLAGGTYSGAGVPTLVGGGYLPWWGVPTFPASARYVAGGMPLVFTQEDFLVLVCSYFSDAGFREHCTAVYYSMCHGFRDRGRVVFFAPTVALVKQQHEEFKRWFSALKVDYLVGPEIEEKAEINVMLTDNQVRA